MYFINSSRFGLSSWDVSVQADFDHQSCLTKITKKFEDDSCLHALKKLERTWGATFRPMSKDLINALPVLKEQDYQRVAMRNLHQMSRTAMGVVDLSASPKKTDSMNADFFGDVAKASTEEAQNLAVSCLYKNRFRVFSSPSELRYFVESLAEFITNGAVKPGHLIRQHDSDRYPYTLAKDLEAAMQQFYEELLARMARKESPRILAPWIEYRMNFTDHFFSDGCGKVSQLLAAFICMRAGHPLPLYKNREEFYLLSGGQRRGINLEEDKYTLQRLTAYYQKLFMPYAVFKHVNGPKQVGRALHLLKQRDPRPLLASDTGNTYQLRNELLSLGADQENNAVSSYQAYTYPFSDRQEFPSTKNTSSALKTFLQEPSNWIPERRREHEAIVDEFQKRGQFLHQSIAATRPNAKKPLLLIMRGNSGAGKTYFLDKLLHSKLPELNFPRVSNLSRLALNPDLLKELLLQETEANIHWTLQLHHEAAMLGRRLISSFKKAKVNFVVDKRLPSLRDLENLLGIKEGEGKAASHEAVMIDIDAPLELSLKAIALRSDRGSEARPPDSSIRSGFLAMRKGRKAIASSKLLDAYYAFARRVDSTTQKPETIKVAYRSLSDGRLHVFKDKLPIWQDMLQHDQAPFPKLRSAL